MNSYRPSIQYHHQRFSAWSRLVKQPRFRAWSQSFVVGALAAVGISSGWVPNLAERAPALMFSTAAVAQAAPITDTEIRNYAEAVLAIEGLRVTAYSDIKTIIGSSNIPDILCNQPGSIDSLPKNVRVVAVKYCNSSKQIVAKSKLRGTEADSVKRFNEITVLVQRDAGLEKRVQNALLQLQKSAGSR